MSSEKEAALDLPQLGVRFLLTATAGMWMENLTTVWQSQLASDNILAQPSVRF